MTELAKVRLDRWLWAARFFKTRAQAKSAIEGGKVDFLLVTGGSRRSQKPKVSKEVARGDMLCIRRGWTSETVVIMDLCEQRGNATRAQALYTETSESMQVRAAEAARRKMEHAGLRVPAARPSKRDRRELRKLKEDAPP
jgi:ribosome-associated heat shock protein Hsp15